MCSQQDSNLRTRLQRPVVVLDYVWPPVKQVGIAGAGLGPSPQQVGDATQHVAAFFLAAVLALQCKQIGLDVWFWLIALGCLDLSEPVGNGRSPSSSLRARDGVLGDLALLSVRAEDLGNFRSPPT